MSISRSPLLLCAAISFLVAAPNSQETMTPLLMSVQDAPVPFTGSDGAVHLVYELWVTNFSSADIVINSVEILGDGQVLQKRDAAAIARRLQPAGTREPVAKLVKSSQALLFIDVSLKPGSKIPAELSHRVATLVTAAPPGRQIITETGGSTTVDRQEVARIHPPLSGDLFISADSCCESSRHHRAAMAINGRVWIAQRFAVDWEQLNPQGRIYSGPREKLQSYTIFGAPALAVADATVVSVIDGHPEQTPGKYPENISLEAADGNCVILDLGKHRYALYAHMQPGSIRVRVAQAVKAGEVIGLVGNSGNSVAPHLHFQVADSPSSLASNGLPYEIDTFRIQGQTPGTKAFDDAEANGGPLTFKPLTSAVGTRLALPLDQLIISFPKIAAGAR
jgi:Peptidase family M23